MLKNSSEAAFNIQPQFLFWDSGFEGLEKLPQMLKFIGKNCVWTLSTKNNRFKVGFTFAYTHIVWLFWAEQVSSYYILPYSIGGWAACWLENSRLSFQWRCYMSWHSEVSKITKLKLRRRSLTVNAFISKSLLNNPLKATSLILFLRVFESKDYLWNKVTIFHSMFLSACQMRQSVKSVFIGHYVLPPAPVQDGEEYCTQALWIILNLLQDDSAAEQLLFIFSYFFIILISFTS